jgi:hypothetical protein
MGWRLTSEFTLGYLAAALFLLACRYAQNRPDAFVDQIFSQTDRCVFGDSQFILRAAFP